MIRTRESEQFYEYLMIKKRNNKRHSNSIDHIEHEQKLNKQTQKSF